jgi:hypothetical protein
MDLSRSFREVVESLNSTAVNTDLTLICPISTTQDATGTGTEHACPTPLSLPPIFPNKVHHLLRMLLD